MSIWSSWKNLFAPRSSLMATRREHILRRHRRAFLESLEGRQLMAGVPQPPQFATSQTAQIVEHGQPELLAPDMLMTDADSTSYPSPYLSFETWYQNLAVGIAHTGVGPGEIGYQNGLVSYGGQTIGSARIVSNGNMSVSLYGGTSVEAVQALLRNITVRTRGDEIYGTRQVSMGFYENYSQPWENRILGHLSIDVDTIGINDAPSLTQVEGGGSYVAGDDPQQVINKVYAKDPDYFGNAYDYASITARISQNGAPEDRLTFADGEWMRVAEGQLYREGRVVGAVSGGAMGEPLQIKFDKSVWWEVNQAIKQLAFSTAADADVSLPREIEVLFADGEGLAAESARVTISVVAPTAPVLDTTLSPKLRPTLEDSVSSASTEVASLLAGAVSDPDAGALQGIAVMYAPSANGVWQYSLSAGQWTDMGTPRGEAALLLPASARLRFVPATNFNGDVSLRYRAWDQTEGVAGGVLDATRYTGTASLSREVESATQTVLPVNDAPVLDNTAAQTLFGAMEDTPMPRATSVYSLVSQAVSDVDTGDLKGIAIFRAPGERGTWQFQLADRVWRSMGDVSESSALLLPASAHVRFVPAADFHGTVRLYYRAWDQTEGLPADKVSLVGNIFPARAFSLATESASVLIESVNDAPSLTLGGTINYRLNADAVLLAPFAQVRDFDSPTFSGGRLTARITAGQSAANLLALSSSFTVDVDNNIKRGDLLVGKLNFGGGQGTTELVATFSPQATRALVQELARAITFKTERGVAGQRTVLFTLTDDQGGVSEDVLKLVNVEQ